MADHYDSLCLLEDLNILKKVTLAHFPTLLLVVGYPIYWVELYFMKTTNGVTSPLAIMLFCTACTVLLIAKRSELYSYITNISSKWIEGERSLQLFVINGVIIFGMMICVCYAALTPPHFSQEFDALNYHYTVPRQHLIVHSFEHITWSTADLFLLPIQFALAPYWFVTTLPNKFPQFIFFIGVILVSVRLASSAMRSSITAVGLILLSIFGSHGIGIQLGTAMLDLVLCYLFLAALDSFISGNWLIAAVEFTFFFWSKSFTPIQMLLIVIVMWFLFIVLKKCGVEGMCWGFNETMRMEVKRYYVEKLKKTSLAFGILSIFVAGPFVAKSIYYAGTPFYPFLPGIFEVNEDIKNNTEYWKSLVEASKEHLAVKDSYGYGRSFAAALRHFWAIVVPEKGVNNRFDYPMGLPYLLFAVPFIFLTINTVRRKLYPIIPLFIMAYWLSWWMGSQQSRFLYIPIILMFIVVSTFLNSRSNVLLCALSMAVLLNAVSIVRAHRGTFFAAKEKFMRAKDLALLKLNDEYKAKKSSAPVYLDYHDVAYAQFPVVVTESKLPFVVQAKIK